MWQTCTVLPKFKQQKQIETKNGNLTSIISTETQIDKAKALLLSFSCIFLLSAYIYMPFFNSNGSFLKFEWHDCLKPYALSGASFLSVKKEIKGQ